MSDACETLFYPFTEQMLDWPKGSGLFFYAEKHKALGRLQNLQIWQPMHDKAQVLDYTQAERFSDLDYALCLLPKQKQEAQHCLAQAAAALKEGGLLVAAAANDAGGKRLPSLFEALGLEPISESKHKCRVVWAHKKDVRQDIINTWLTEGQMQNVTIAGQNYISKPGLFGWNEADKGSALLLSYIENLKGAGADFGCGYGFLSKNILQQHQDITKLYALDVDSSAVEACVRNAPVEAIWHDLRKKPNLPILDFIVMNPPFHAGKKTDISLGVAMLQTAAQCLKKGGTLYMVANKQLPYEAVLERAFFKVLKCAEEKGFKIFKASK